MSGDHVEHTSREIVDELREIFPNGHPKYLPIAFAQLTLHSLKNGDYAGGGSPLGNFERVSAILALYPRLHLSNKKVVALVYMLKQLDAVLWGLNSNITHKVEGLPGRLDDIAVYANIVQCMVQDEEKDVEKVEQVGKLYGKAFNEESSV